ncbi:hypothetical protein ACCS68_13980, partial [Rhizobium beringeri]
MAIGDGKRSRPFRARFYLSLTPILHPPFRRQGHRGPSNFPCAASGTEKIGSSALIWAIDNKVDFALFHEAGKIIIAHFGGDEIYLPSRWSDKRWHIGLED